MVNRLDAAEGRVTADVAVTVAIQGLIVSGVVISAHEYLRRLGGQFAEGFADTPVPEVGAEGSDGSERLAQHFLHLKDVTILIGSGAVHVPLWEGRLACIGGWSLGSPTRRG